MIKSKDEGEIIKEFEVTSLYQVFWRVFVQLDRCPAIVCKWVVAVVVVVDVDIVVDIVVVYIVVVDIVVVVAIDIGVISSTNQLSQPTETFHCFISFFLFLRFHKICNIFF